MCLERQESMVDDWMPTFHYDGTWQLSFGAEIPGATLIQP